MFDLVIKLAEQLTLWGNSGAVVGVDVNAVGQLERMQEARRKTLGTGSDGRRVGGGKEVKEADGGGTRNKKVGDHKRGRTSSARELRGDLNVGFAFQHDTTRALCRWLAANASFHRLNVTLGQTWAERKQRQDRQQGIEARQEVRGGRRSGGGVGARGHGKMEERRGRVRGEGGGGQRRA